MMDAIMEMGLKKRKMRRRARAGIKVQERKRKALLVLQENRDQQQLIESARNEAQRVEDQDLLSLNDSVKNSLQCENNCQPPADPMQLSPKLNLSQKSEKTIDLLQPEKNFLSVSQAQQWSPVQVKNDGNTAKLDHQNGNVSLHNSIKNKLQSVENRQPSADFMLSSPLEQQNLPQNSEGKVDLLQSEQKSFLLSQNQHCLPMQIKNEEAEKLDHPNGTASSLHNSIKDNLQTEENSQPSADFMQSSSIEQKLLQSSKEKDEISQTQESSSSSCQNTEKVTKTVEEEEEPSSRINIKLLLLKQEKLLIQHKNRIKKFKLQDKIISYFHKYIKLCNNHEDKVFKLKQKLLEYELQIARENERLKKSDK